MVISREKTEGTRKKFHYLHKLKMVNLKKNNRFIIAAFKKITNSAERN
jgi:hypothetical protein